MREAQPWQSAQSQRLSSVPKSYLPTPLSVCHHRQPALVTQRLPRTTSHHNPTDGQTGRRDRHHLNFPHPDSPYSFAFPVAYSGRLAGAYSPLQPWGSRPHSTAPGQHRRVSASDDIGILRSRSDATVPRHPVVSISPSGRPQLLITVARSLVRDLSRRNRCDTLPN